MYIVCACMNIYVFIIVIKLYNLVFTYSYNFILHNIDSHIYNFYVKNYKDCFQWELIALVIIDFNIQF